MRRAGGDNVTMRPLSGAASIFIAPCFELHVRFRRVFSVLRGQTNDDDSRELWISIYPFLQIQALHLIQNITLSNKSNHWPYIM